jgi:hypothetical protein
MIHTNNMVQLVITNAETRVERKTLSGVTLLTRILHGKNVNQLVHHHLKALMILPNLLRTDFLEGEQEIEIGWIKKNQKNSEELMQRSYKSVLKGSWTLISLRLFIHLVTLKKWDSIEPSGLKFKTLF